ncbi:uncharacterized protein LOC123656513 [Melitaea cinxia]|uniref:uncharacterized protein LOC123656513 n=1 Tax=Melitaea cinxia TaxID=113334 RepID=UPI001E274A37|nr:uncharacterized protein LOC123656513 [Melitaea cinxia]
MEASNKINTLSQKTYPSSKIVSVESSLQQTLINFKELMSELKELHSESSKYREMYLLQKDKCERQTCESCVEIKKQLTNEKEILESVVTALNKLSETRDFNILDKIFRLINRDTLTPPNIVDDNEVKERLVSPKKELSVLENVCEESLSEIEGTPGRKSPIIQSKRIKSNSAYSLSLKEKKKCPENWSTPEKKSIKLSFPTPTSLRNKSSKMKQSRLNLIRIKTTSVVDLTCSPETRTHSENNLQCNIKKEMLENDDTILPSPTSGRTVQFPMYKSVTKDSPIKFKIPSEFKCKLEKRDSNTENVFVKDAVVKDGDDSINLLQQFPNRFKSPLKKDKLEDVTHCPDESISLLQRLNKIDEKSKTNSPKKSPLTENSNLMNMQQSESQQSVSILQEDIMQDVKSEIIKSRPRINLEPVYKEMVSRKKSEKRALPAWSCDECKNFYAELYKDNTDMLAKKMDECSKHRGRNNPVRPKTPEGFWNPRWHVPEDTEEFNLRNNAV